MTGADAARAVVPVERPLDATVVVPGSKSITNRALVCAALARGQSRLVGALFSDDTEAMVGCLRSLGIVVRTDEAAALIEVEGVAGSVPTGPASLDVRQSGTTARFVAPLVALGRGAYHIDAAAPMRRRPMGELFDSLAALGCEIDAEHDPEGRPVLPVTVLTGGVNGGRIDVRGDVSSQFLSGLLLASPYMHDGLDVAVTSELVSKPYVDLTLDVMAAFGAPVVRDGYRSFRVAPTGYVGQSYRIEPDASAASYFFAAAAVVGGRVRVEGLTRRSRQGDVAFVDALARMGATVHADDTGIEVTGTGALHGIEIDMGDCSDTAQTLAAVAVFADSPTRITGIGFIRAKETDRIAAVVTELARLGIRADEELDGLVIHPGPPQPGVVRTYDDHRMAMSFAIVGLRAPGIEIADPGCVAKTFPGFWAVLDGLHQ
jgi:3-phosphoshikimate 1-carboxyvinyltransferase